MKTLTYGSLFSGTECMSAAAIGLPLVPRFFAEVEPYPCAILRSKFPNVPNLGDVTKIRYDHEQKTLTNGFSTVDLRDGLDVLAGGSPCQDFSVAGLRAGARSETLDDGGTTRSSLIYTYVRLVREIRPRWIVYENVPGMLTSNEGRDFAHFLVALAQCGYGDFAWRVLDAQFVRVDGMERAVPQRRRRVWLVGRIGANDGKSAEILLEPYGDPGDRPPRRKTREEIARSVAARAGLHGGVVARAGREGEVKPQGFRTGSFAQFVPDEVSGTLDCRHMTCTAQGMPCLAVDAPANVANTLLRRFDGSPRPEIGGGNIIAAAPASFDPYEPGGIKTVREDGAATTVVNGTNPGHHNAVAQRVTNSNGGDVAPTLSVTDLVKQTTGQADNGGGYVCATIENHKSGSQVREANVAGTMGATRNASAANDNPLVVATPAVCIAENTIGRGERTGGNGVGAQEVIAYTLDTVAPHAVAYGMNPQASLMHPCTEGVAQTLAVSHEGGVVQPRRSTCLTPGDPIQKRVYAADGPAPTLQAIAEGSGVSAQAFVLPTRRAVPIDIRNATRVTHNGQGAGILGEKDASPTLCADFVPGVACDDPRSSFASPRSDAADGLPEVVVRRLTPTECERLMGLPDNWTRVTFTPAQIADPDLIAYFRRVHDDWQKMIAEDGKTPKPKTEAFVRDWLTKISDPATCPDAPRFKVCGNGWATNCPRWILLNLLRAEGIDPWYGEDCV